MEMNIKTKRRQKKRVEIKKLVILSLGFFLVLAVSNGIELLQKMLYSSVDGLATATTALVYGCSILSALFVAVPVIHTIGPKWGMMSMLLAHAVYCIGNFYPSWWTMAPVSALLGFTSTIGWSSQGIYMVGVAAKFASLANRDRDTIIGIFYGIFFGFIGFARPLGVYISYDILEFLNTTETFGNYTNTTIEPPYFSEEDQLDIQFSNSSIAEIDEPQVCGASYCPYIKTLSAGEEALALEPDQELVYVLLGVYLVCTLAGIIITATLPNQASGGHEDDDEDGEEEDPYDSYYYWGQDEEDEDNKETKNKASPLRTLRELLVLCKDYRPLLLAVPYLTSGMVRAMHVWSYNRAFVTCAHGPSAISYVIACDGFGFTVMSLLSGYLTKYIPRLFHIGALSLVNIILATTWLLWEPTPDDLVPFLVLAFLQGCTSGAWRVHTAVLTGTLFNNSLAAAFSNLMLWNSLGHILVFVYNTFLCLYVIASLFIGLVVCAFISYCALELKMTRKKKTLEKRRVMFQQFEADMVEYDYDIEANNNEYYDDSADELKAFLQGIGATVTYEPDESSMILTL